MTMTTSKQNAELRRLENIEEMALEAAIGEKFTDKFQSHKPGIQPFTYVKFTDGRQSSKLQQTLLNDERSYYNDAEKFRVLTNHNASTKKSHKNTFSKVKSEDNLTHNSQVNKKSVSSISNSNQMSNSSNNIAKANEGLLITNGILEQGGRQLQKATNNQATSEMHSDDSLGLFDEEDIPANYKFNSQQQLQQQYYLQQQYLQQKALIIVKGNDQIIISNTSQQQQSNVALATQATQQEQEFQRRRQQSPPFAPPSTPQQAVLNLQSQQQQQQQQPVVAHDQQHQLVAAEQQPAVARDKPGTPSSPSSNTANKEKPAVFSEFPCRDELDVEIETMFLNDDDMVISLADSGSNTKEAVQPTPRAWNESATSAAQLRQYLSEDTQKPAPQLNNTKNSKQLNNSKTNQQLGGLLRLTTLNKENYESGSDQEATSRSEGSLQDDPLDMQYLESRKLSASWSPDINGREQSMSPFAYQHPTTNYNRPGFHHTTKAASKQTSLESNLQKFRLRDHEADLKKKLKQIPSRSKPEKRKSIPLASDPFAASFPSYFQSQTQPKSTVFPMQNGGADLDSRMNTNINMKVDAKEQRKIDTAKAYVAAKFNEIMFDIPTAAGPVRYRHKVADVGWELRTAARAGGVQSDDALHQLLLLEEGERARGGVAWPFIPGMNRMNASEQPIVQQVQQQHQTIPTPATDNSLTVKQYHRQIPPDPSHSQAGHHHSTTKAPPPPDNPRQQHHRTASNGSINNSLQTTYHATSKEIANDIPSQVAVAEVTSTVPQPQAPSSPIKPSTEPHPPRKLKPLTRKVVNKSRRVSMPNQVAVTTALTAVAAKDDNNSVTTKSLPLATHEPYYAHNLPPQAHSDSVAIPTTSTSLSHQSQLMTTNEANANVGPAIPAAISDKDSDVLGAMQDLDLLPSSTIFVNQIPTGVDILNLEADGDPRIIKDQVGFYSTETMNNSKLKPSTTLNRYHFKSKKAI